MMFHGLDDYFEWVRSLPILARAGEHPLTDECCVRSWIAADAMCDDDESVNHVLAIRNRLCAALMRVDRSAVTKRWNVQGDRIWAHAELFRDEGLLPRFPQLHEYPKLLNRTLNHTVIAAQELLYNDLVQRDEAMQLVEYFQTGHMIVGYRGEFPEGYRIIF